MLGTSKNPPRVKGKRGQASLELDETSAEKAIKAARAALSYITPGPPLIHYGVRGEVHIDIPLMYHGFAIDRMHFNPYTMKPSPKGKPVHAYLAGRKLDEQALLEAARAAVSELRILDAVEYREPEDSWVVPLAWRTYIVAHLKIDSRTHEIVPDYGLTEEVRRHVA